MKWSWHQTEIKEGTEPKQKVSVKKAGACKAQWRERFENEEQHGTQAQVLLSAWGREQEEAKSSDIPLVPIHSWSCSSLKVSLTFPPDLLYMPDKGTAGRRSWRHKSEEHSKRGRDQKHTEKGQLTGCEDMATGTPTSQKVGLVHPQNAHQRAGLPGHP